MRGHGQATVILRNPEVCAIAGGEARSALMGHSGRVRRWVTPDRSRTPYLNVIPARAVLIPFR